MRVAFGRFIPRQFTGQARATPRAPCRNVEIDVDQSTARAGPSTG
jgi:hypothetical protein